MVVVFAVVVVVAVTAYTEAVVVVDTMDNADIIVATEDIMKDKQGTSDAVEWADWTS